MREIEVNGPAGLRVRHRGGLGLAHQALAQRAIVGEGIGKGLGAGRIGLAASENALQRALGIDGDGGAEHGLRIHHAIENQRARGLRKTPRIVLRHARAIRTAIAD